MIYTHTAGGTNRTCDSLLGKQALLPLSYTCIHNYIQDTTPSKCENTGYCGSTQGSFKRLKRTLTSTCHMIHLSYDIEERSGHDGRSTSSITQRARMEPFLPYTLRKKVSVCSKVAHATSLPWQSCKARGDNRGSSLREIGKSQVKNKASSSSGWLGTTKKIFVVASYLPNARKVEGKRPRDSLPVSSIATHGKICQWLYKTQVSVRKRRIMHILPILVCIGHVKHFVYVPKVEARLRNEQS